MVSSGPQPITLHFQDFVRVAGEIIAGSVDLNVALAQENHIEHLRIKFRGSIVTRVTTRTRRTSTTEKQTIPLIHAEISLWKQGTPFPAGSQVVSFPFQAQLPANLPPSFHCNGNSHAGAISYSLEVVGDRPGIFRKNTRIRRVFSVVTAASQAQLLVKDSLRQGWDGAWNVTIHEQKIRQGFWGEYSRVSGSLFLPKLSSFPVGAPIPYNFHVIAETKTLNRSDRPEDKHGKPLFPVPPSQSSKVMQTLRRHTEIRLRNKVRRLEVNYDLQVQGIRQLADLGVASTRPGPPVIVDEPEWVPKDDKGRGFWRRTVHFGSTLAFPFSPTSSTQALDWVYTLHFEVPFPGMGNNLKLQLPIHLGPGSACPPAPIGASKSSSSAYTGPPPMVDLPQAYWSDESHWDEKDEKS